MSVATNKRLFQFVSVVLSCAIVLQSQVAIAEQPSLFQQAMEAKESKRWKDARLFLLAVPDDDPDYDRTLNELSIVYELEKENEARDSQYNRLLICGFTVVAAIIGTVVLVRGRAVPTAEVPADKPNTVPDPTSPSLVRKTQTQEQSTSPVSAPQPLPENKVPAPQDLTPPKPSRTPPGLPERDSQPILAAEGPVDQPEAVPVVRSSSRLVRKVQTPKPAPAPQPLSLEQAPAATAKPPISKSVVKLTVDPVSTAKNTLKRWERGDTPWIMLRDDAAKAGVEMFRVDPDGPVCTIKATLKKGATDAAKEIVDLANKAQRTKGGDKK